MLAFLLVCSLSRHILCAMRHGISAHTQLGKAVQVYRAYSLSECADGLTTDPQESKVQFSQEVTKLGARINKRGN